MSLGTQPLNTVRVFLKNYHTDTLNLFIYLHVVAVNPCAIFSPLVSGVLSAMVQTRSLRTIQPFSAAYRCNKFIYYYLLLYHYINHM